MGTKNSMKTFTFKCVYDGRSAFLDDLIKNVILEFRGGDISYVNSYYIRGKKRKGVTAIFKTRQDMIDAASKIFIGLQGFSMPAVLSLQDHEELVDIYSTIV